MRNCSGKNLTGGRFRPEQVAGLNRNQWQLSPEWVAGFNRNTHPIKKWNIILSKTNYREDFLDGNQSTSQEIYEVDENREE